MRIALLGGTRFIGHAAALHAASRGHDVSVLHRGAHPSEIAAVRPIAVDRADPSALCETLARLSPDVLVDTRAMTRIDAEVTALALKVLSLPAVVLSSIDVYAQFGRVNGLPAPPPEARLTEDSPLTIPFPFRDLGPHDGGPDYDKKDVEAVVRAATEEGAPGVTVLRLPAVYGPRDYRRRFGEIVDALDRGETEMPCSGGAPWRWAHVHVTDAARAIVLAAEQRPSGFDVFHVAEAVTPSMRERAEAIADAMGERITWRETADLPPSRAAYGPMPNDLVLDTSKIRARLGYTEITTEGERLRTTIDWLRESRAGA